MSFLASAIHSTLHTFAATDSPLTSPQAHLQLATAVLNRLGAGVRTIPAKFLDRRSSRNRPGSQGTSEAEAATVDSAGSTRASSVNGPCAVCVSESNLWWMSWPTHPSPREGDILKGISGGVTAKGFQPVCATGTWDWNLGLEPGLEPQTSIPLLTGALHPTFQPNQAGSCSVELTESWCRAAYSWRTALLPRRGPQFTQRVVRSAAV